MRSGFPALRRTRYVFSVKWNLPCSVCHSSCSCCVPHFSTEKLPGFFYQNQKEKPIPINVLLFFKTFYKYYGMFPIVFSVSCSLPRLNIHSEKGQPFEQIAVFVETRVAAPNVVCSRISQAFCPDISCTNRCKCQRPPAIHGLFPIDISLAALNKSSGDPIISYLAVVVQLNGDLQWKHEMLANV